MISASNGRKETHLSPGGSPWLPFDSPEELEQAKKEAEAEAQKLLDDLPKPPIGKPKKPKNSSLPKHLPQVKKLCDVPENERICPQHGPMAMIGIDTTETLVYEPAKLYSF